ncbi:hypothetical protein D7X12_19395 [Corallococcus sicarius]|uniref:HEAT repeat domain-containing protein n=2 Tax=Corallococcus sicarius TaxID=2316726 RepID=A0A3A8N9P8_9BACT|nr:hypothetical protein D7X12_19395 [Corallococcus sicarius]
MVEREGLRSHEPILAPAQPDPVEAFVRRNPDEAHDVCTDAVKKNLHPVREESHRAAEMALRCVAASGDTRSLPFLEWVAFQSAATSGVAGQAVYLIGRLAPEKKVWALTKRLEMEGYSAGRSRLADDLLSSQDPRAAEVLDAAAKRETDESVRGQMIRNAYLLRHPEQCVRYGAIKEADGEMPVCEYVCASGVRWERSTNGKCPEYIQPRIQIELERAVLADQTTLGEDRPGSEHLQAFVERHGENAVPLFERLVAEAAKSGGNENPSLIMAAVDGLVLLGKGEALEALASSDKAGFGLSRAALDGLVKLAPGSEKVGILVARLRQRRDPQDQSRTVDDLMELGLPEAVPYLKDIRPTISDAKTARQVDKAIGLLEEPGVCRVYQETFREESRRWGCVYRCAGAVRSRERVMESACPRTLPNKDE